MEHTKQDLINELLEVSRDILTICNRIGNDEWTEFAYKRIKLAVKLINDHKNGLDVSEYPLYY